MFDLFMNYCQITGCKKTLIVGYVHQCGKKLQLAPDIVKQYMEVNEFIFIHDHFEMLKDEYRKVYELAKALKGVSDIPEEYYSLLERLYEDD